MNQLTMDFTLSRRTDPPTSKHAASKSGEFRAKHESKIFGAICDAAERGATYKEIAQTTGMEPVAVARRLSSMESRKLITRKANEFGDPLATRSGCAVWWKA
jgi:hypothetical protein